MSIFIKYTSIIIVVILSSLTAAWSVYNFAPLSFFDNSREHNYGATVTTILGSDTLSASRTTINTNFSNLNANKFELSDWYATTSAPQITTLANLATTGTIVSGSWNASVIAATYGGTGTSSPTAKQLMIGNGSSGFQVIGFGVANQFLTSNGPNTLPSWTTASVDQTQAYSWTGTHRFNATTTIAASSTSNNALVLNSVSYAFPSTLGGSSTILSTNASGQLSWVTPQRQVLYANGNVNTSNSGTASSTHLAVKIPANLFTTDKILEVRAVWQPSGSAGYCYPETLYGDGTATTSYGAFSQCSIQTNYANNCINTTVIAATSSSSQYGYSKGETFIRGNAPTFLNWGTSTSYSLTGDTYIGFQQRGDAAGQTCYLRSATVELIRN